MTRRREFEPIRETEFDVIVIGTGLCESLIAASLAQSGSKVLHLDSNNFYGGSWSSIKQSQLDDAINQLSSTSHHDLHEFETPSIDEGRRIAESFTPNHECVPIDNVTLGSLLFPEGCRPIPSNWLSEPPVINANQLWLDIISRPIMAGGDMVKLLRKTQVGHYVVFHPLTSLFVEFGADGTQKVPGSRADIFQNQFVSMLEKRLLMRFVKKCYEATAEIDTAENVETEIEIEDKDTGPSFEQEMTEMKVTDKLKKFLLHSIVFQSEMETDLSRAAGINAVKKYQESLLAYGTKTPFLCTSYGTGELPQAFCRFCAVNGGTYVLRRGAAAIICEKQSVKNEDSYDRTSTATVGVITSEHEVIRSKQVFISAGLLQNSPFATTISSEECYRTWRFIAVITGSVVRETFGGRAMLTVPRNTVGNKSSAVRIRQLDSSVNVCPENVYILYGETIDKKGTEEDLLTAIRYYVDDGSSIQTNGSAEKIESGDNSQIQISETQTQPTSATPDEKPRMIWGISFSRNVPLKCVSVAEGVVAVSTPENEIDCDSVIAEAEKCFKIVKPNDEFFPEPKQDEHLAKTQ